MKKHESALSSEAQQVQNVYNKYLEKWQELIVIEVAVESAIREHEAARWRLFHEKVRAIGGELCTLGMRNCEIFQSTEKLAFIVLIGKKRAWDTLGEKLSPGIYRTCVSCLKKVATHHRSLTSSGEQLSIMEVV